MLDNLLDPAINKVVGYLLPAAGGAVLTQLVNKRFRTADKDADRELDREIKEDEARDKFRNELSGRIDKLNEQICQLEEKHQECERGRREDNERCASERAVDREQVATLRGQIDFFRDLMRNNPSRSPRRAAPHATRKKQKG